MTIDIPTRPQRLRDAIHHIDDAIGQLMKAGGPDLPLSPMIADLERIANRLANLHSDEVWNRHAENPPGSQVTNCVKCGQSIAIYPPEDPVDWSWQCGRCSRQALAVPIRPALDDDGRP
jgi:hypothetical protein